MNKLPSAKRVQILAMLCGGSSVHSIARVVPELFWSVVKLLKDAGHACEAFHDQTVCGVFSGWVARIAPRKHEHSASASPRKVYRGECCP